MLVLTVVGLLAVDSWDRLSLLAQERLREKDARAVVVDARASLSLLDQAAWLEVADSPLVQSVVPPVALVVSPVLIERARNFALEMAMRGYVRGPFIGLHAATAWAARCREHWPHLPPVERYRIRAVASLQTPPVSLSP